MTRKSTIKSFLSQSRVLLGWTLIIVAVVWALFRLVPSSKGLGDLLLRLLPESKKVKNVLLISIDTCRADHLSCYGYPRRTTPNIDALAADAILFENIIVPMPLTLPSHSSMLTGTTPLYHKVRNNNNYRLSDQNTTLAEILKKKGFVTAAVVSSFVLDSEFGLNQGFDLYHDQFLNPTQSTGGGNQRRADETSHLAASFLQKYHKQPFFLFLHYFDPHDPYEPPEPFASVFKDDPYAGEIAFADYCIGQVIKKLKELNLYDSTLIIVTSDHGEGLGEHSENTHGYFIYHSTLHVPLIIKIPGGPKNKRIDSLNGLVDIVPTVCSLLDIEPPASVQGEPLLGQDKQYGPEIEQRRLYCESLLPTRIDAAPLLGILTERWKYIYTSRPELYDLQNDPKETNNLIDEQPQQAKMMKQRLWESIEQLTATKDSESSRMLDEQSRKKLESLGYVAAGTLDESLSFDPNTYAPADLIEVHKTHEKIVALNTKMELEKARELCDQLLEKWPDITTTNFLLSQVAMQQNDNETAITHLKRYLTKAEQKFASHGGMLNVKPEFATSYNNLGLLLAEQGKTDEAVEHYKKALAHNPKMSEAVYNLGNIFLKRGQMEQAIEQYQKAILINPELPEAHLNIANALLQQYKFEEAISHLNTALTLRPGWLLAQTNLNMAMQQKQKFEQAATEPNRPLEKNFK